MSIHTKCRGAYPSAPANIIRAPLGDDQVPWTTEMQSYAPPSYTSPIVLGTVTGKVPVWADAFDPNEAALPKNPAGRTGLVGRGLLGRYGKNRAADPICSWVLIDDATKMPIIDPITNMVEHYVLVIVRGPASGAGDFEVALPGGMVDDDDATINATLSRELCEEALQGVGGCSLATLFKEHGTTIYKGYVDDSRNTDIAWMTTTAVALVDYNGDTLLRHRGFLPDGKPRPGGDDTRSAKLIRYHPGLTMFASHAAFLVANAAHVDSKARADFPLLH